MSDTTQETVWVVLGMSDSNQPAVIRGLYTGRAQASAAAVKCSDKYVVIAQYALDQPPAPSCLIDSDDAISWEPLRS